MTPARLAQIKACEAAPRPGDVWRVDPISYSFFSERYGTTFVESTDAAFRLGQWAIFMTEENVVIERNDNRPWTLVHQRVSHGIPWPTWIGARINMKERVVCRPGGLQVLVVSVATTRLEPNVIALCVVRLSSGEALLAWLPWSDLSTSWTLLTRV